MKPRVLFAVVLLVCLVGIAIPSAGGEEAETSRDAGSGGESPDQRVIVYYFHGTRRCKTCRSIEANAAKTVKGEFADELASGRVAWRVVDFDQKENEHFIEDFELPSSSLVLVEMEGDQPVRHQVLQEVWFLAGDEQKFASYLSEALREFLG